MKATRLPMLRTVKGALRRLTRQPSSFWCGDDKIGLSGHLVTEREQRLNRIRNERLAYERFSD